jgi:hypothetical protein
MDVQKQIERIKSLQANPPYAEMLNSDITATRLAAENATLGWVGALSTVLVILESEVSK